MHMKKVSINIYRKYTILFYLYKRIKVLFLESSLIEAYKLRANKTLNYAQRNEDSLVGSAQHTYIYVRAHMILVASQHNHYARWPKISCECCRVVSFRLRFEVDCVYCVYSWSSLALHIIQTHGEVNDLLHCPPPHTERCSVALLGG